MRIGNDSIAQKLTWMNMLVSGTALLLACAAFTGYDWINFRMNAASNLSVQAQVIAANAASALIFNDPESAQNTLSVLKASPSIVSAGIYTLDERPFAAYFRTGATRVPKLPVVTPGQSVAHLFDHGRAVVVVPIVSDGKKMGTVYIESDLQALYVRLARYVGIATVVLIVCLMAALMGSSLFRRSVAEPIVALAETARIVSREKNYSVRARPALKMDEIAVLIEAFNEMLGQIELRDEELQVARNNLERKVDERTAQLAAANKELEAFSYSVSHDLRAPLRSIDGFSQAILEDYADKLDAAGKENLQRVRAAATRMGTLIDDLLKLSRVTRAEMRREASDLSAIVKSIATSLEEAEPSRNVNFKIEDGLTIDGDPRLLRVALENLLRNAWKYTSRHDQARIEFGRSEQSGKSIFYVRDDGAGFDPQYSDRLFGAFQRLHGVNEFPGTGIGLATVQRIIRRHGGDIWAEAEVEKGATFYFSVG
jgi:signal transduction histidine kinase